MHIYNSVRTHTYIGTGKIITFAFHFRFSLFSLEDFFWKSGKGIFSLFKSESESGKVIFSLFSLSLSLLKSEKITFPLFQKKSSSEKSEKRKWLCDYARSNVWMQIMLSSKLATLSSMIFINVLTWL